MNNSPQNSAIWHSDAPPLFGGVKPEKFNYQIKKQMFLIDSLRKKRFWLFSSACWLKKWHETCSVVNDISPTPGNYHNEKNSTADRHFAHARRSNNRSG
ncbi:hypothetical protein [Rahnella sp. AA]|uniref:hypothetical protein n=1 Tax=Rahnella sp. AA TaxID=2057180 RepID=UPI0012FE8E3F|nr:hypothetical protein [Rahnella sp. AA]